jgi:flagellar basal body-associated protein FliL
MRLPFILDVALGLIFIYLILSLLASEIQELIATVLQWRAIHLKKSIQIFLSGDAKSSEEIKVIELVNKIYGNPLIKSINQEAKGFFSILPRKITWAIADLTRPIRKAIAKNKQDNHTFDKYKSAPSYISSDTFAVTLIEELKLPTIIYHLTEARLEKVKNQHLQEVRTILAKSLRQLQSIELSPQITQDIKEDFETLSLEYSTIVNDFKNQRFDINTSVSRMKDSMDKYINNFRSNLENDDHLLIETHKRLEAFYKHIFPSVEEAIILGGLKPSINELMGIMQTGKAVYTEVETSLKDQEDTTYQTIKNLLQELPDGIKDNIVSIARQAQYKAKSTEEGIKILREEIENCFDSSMQRAGGVYKRNAKGVAILIGLALAFGANADTFHIIDRLSKDSVLREAIVYKVEQTIEQESINGDLRNLDTKQILEDIKLPIGWTQENLQEQLGWSRVKIQNVPILSILTMLAGWIVSGLAIAMGAPFWFDLLSKVMNVKNSGKSQKK